MQPFWQRVAETVTWCSPRANPSDPRHSLRSEEIGNEEIKDWDTEKNYVICMKWIAQHRQCNLPTAALLAATPDLCGGRFVLFFPDSNLADGAAEDASRGFFDTFNTPPWDAWVAFVSGDGNSGDENLNRCRTNYLVAWVPPVFLEVAASGIRVNPEECIQWLDETDVSLAKFLQDGIQ